MKRSTDGATVAAGLLMLFQAALAGLAGLGLLASARRLQRFTFAAGVAHHRAGAGLILVLLAVVMVAVGGFVMSGAATARMFAYGLEAVAVIGAMLRLGRHPGIAIVGVAMAILVIVLLSTETNEGSASDSRARGGPAPAG